MPLVWDALLHASPASRRRPDLGAGVCREKRVVLGSTRPSSPPHAEERESGHASPCISQTTRPWSIGNRNHSMGTGERCTRSGERTERARAPTKSPHTTPRMLLPSPSNAGFRFPRALAPRPVSPAPSHRIEKTPTQFAAAARHRTPHRTRRGERVDMPLPTSLKFALLLQPRPCRLRHALTFRQGWSSLRRRGSGTAAPRQGPPSSAESAPRDPATATPK
jgi:hypothetical protein